MVVGEVLGEQEEGRGDGTALMANHKQRLLIAEQRAEVGKVAPVEKVEGGGVPPQHGLRVEIKEGGVGGVAAFHRELKPSALALAHVAPGG